VEERELQEIVNKAIVELPPKYRDAVVPETSRAMYEEVSDILSIPGGTVRSRINCGRLILKKKLEPYGVCHEMQRCPGSFLLPPSTASKCSRRERAQSASLRVQPALASSRFSQEREACELSSKAVCEPSSSRS
jgi:hypothetical protein